MKNIFWQFLAWHYCDAPRSILRAFGNFLVFGFNYFSIGLLTKTWFSHWRKYKESYGRGFDFKRWASAFVGNMISRCLGAFVRTIIIFIGLIAEFFILIGAVIIFLTWIFLPLILLFTFYFSLRLFL